MSVNSSSSFNVSLPPPHSFSNSLYHIMHRCLNATNGVFSITAFTIVNILFLLPLYMRVIYLGIQRWRQQRPRTTMSHSDIFTYHMVIIEVMNVIWSILQCCGVLAGIREIVDLCFYLSCMNISGQQLFHILTCVERYLAVVHPITYMSLRKAKGIRIRNIIIGCVWLLCFLSVGAVTMWNSRSLTITSYCNSVFALLIISFCSLSVLYVLIRARPGEGGGRRLRLDPSKLRAFYTIMVILGVLLLRCGGSVVSAIMFSSQQLGETEKCIALFSMVWYNLPSSLVLPLLFLHRAGNLPCCMNNNESGRGSD